MLIQKGDVLARLSHRHDKEIFRWRGGVMHTFILCAAVLFVLFCFVSAFWEEDNPRYYEYINRRQRAGKKKKQG